MADCCLTLICSPALEEKLLDTLLEQADGLAFTSAHAHSHGKTRGTLSTEEQVMGRSRAVQVQVLLPKADLDSLRQTLRAEFAGAGLRYWVTQVEDQGEFA